MRNISLKDILKILLIVVILLLFTKVDYRLYEIAPGSIQDDSIYYYHTQTIAIDFDFDYTNQLDGNLKDSYIRDDGLPVPRQSVGTGIIASPILFITNIISKYLNTVNSLNYFTYSLIPIIFLFLSVSVIQVMIKSNNQNRLLISLFLIGSGISYFGFERFSMSTVYEFTTFLIVMYLTHKYINSQNDNLLILIPLFQFLGLTVRWNNYHIFLVPIIYLLLNNRKISSLIKSKVFIIGNLIGVFLFLLHTKLIYGIYTFSQTDIYPNEGWVVYERLELYSNINLLGRNLLTIFNHLFTILFSQEFGLFFFCPIVFVSLFYIFFYTLNKKYYLALNLFLFYSISILPVILFESHGGSYGFRYLYTLIPLNIYIFFKDHFHNKFLIKYLIIFSIFGSLSQLFFESTQASSLSEDKIINSFDNLVPYANPEYLTGILSSILKLQAYQKIIFTSFIGLISIKLLSLIQDPLVLISKYVNLDPKSIEYIDLYLSFDWTLIFIILLIYMFFAIFVIDKNKKSY